jgi:hypothetical protein
VVGEGRVYSGRENGGRKWVALSSSPRDLAILGRSDADLPPSSTRRRRSVGMTFLGAPKPPTCEEAHPTWSARRVRVGTSQQFVPVPKVSVGEARPDLIGRGARRSRIGAGLPPPGNSTLASRRCGFRAGGGNLTSKSKGQKEARGRPAGRDHLAASASPADKTMPADTRKLERTDQSITHGGTPYFLMENRLSRDEPFTTAIHDFFKEDRRRKTVTAQEHIRMFGANALPTSCGPCGPI